MADRGADDVHLDACRVERIVVVRVQRIDDLLAAGVERILVGLLRQADQHFVERWARRRFGCAIP